MRSLLSATVLLGAAVVPGYSQNSAPFESLQIQFACREVAETGEKYLSEHRIFGTEKTRFQILSIVGRESMPVTAGSIRELTHGRKLKPWTDAQGNEITDFKVYWDYAARGTGEKLPLGIWRLRLAHYQPRGEMKLASAAGGCKVDFQLTFGAWGVNVIAILPLDSSWSYGSNGRLEREYLDGISAVLAQRKAVRGSY